MVPELTLCVCQVFKSFDCRWWQYSIFRTVPKCRGEHVARTSDYLYSCAANGNYSQDRARWRCFCKFFDLFWEKFAVVSQDSSLLDENSIRALQKLYLENPCGLTLAFPERLLSKILLLKHRPFEFLDLWQTQTSKLQFSWDSTLLPTNCFLSFWCRVNGPLHDLT